MNVNRLQALNVAEVRANTAKSCLSVCRPARHSVDERSAAAAD